MRWTEIWALVYLQFSLLVYFVEAQCDTNNDTIPEICRQQTNNNVSCTELSGECVECMWPPDCDYGRNVNVTCESRFDDIECIAGQVCNCSHLATTYIYSITLKN